MTARVEPQLPARSHSCATSNCRRLMRDEEEGDFWALNGRTSAMQNSRKAWPGACVS